MWPSLLILGCIVSETVEQSLFRAARGRPWREQYFLFYCPGILLHVLRLGAWLALLRSVQLSVALPLTALTFVTIALTSRWLFGELVNRRRWAGIGLVVAGFILVSMYGHA